jgi:hypothetical protein
MQCQEATGQAIDLSRETLSLWAMSDETRSGICRREMPEAGSGIVEACLSSGTNMAISRERVKQGTVSASQHQWYLM